jgi:prepilin-type N-terminal cleavage/methylation domain-containing protein
MKKSSPKGFTLIEILIVVAIIAILASVVLVGLGPTQQKGRDARRLSDLRETQNALELYYNAEGHYPDAPSWDLLSSDITNAGIGISQPLPSDPTDSGSYVYSYLPVGNPATSYFLVACMEGVVPLGYTPPTVPSGITVPTCPAGTGASSAASSTYIISM